MSNRDAWFQPNFRVTFLGVFPSLWLTTSQRRRYDRHFASRAEAQAAFEGEPTAVRFDRWEPQVNGWVMLLTKDGQHPTKPARAAASRTSSRST